MPEARARLRDLGVASGVLAPGALNAITDVPGIRVGHVTLAPESGYPEEVCTGVTAVLCDDERLPPRTLQAGSSVLNGFGKTAGLVQLDELGEIEGPLLLTNTFSVGAVLEGGVRYHMGRDAGVGDGSTTPNVVVAECNDGYLNDLRRLAVRPEHALEAIAAAEGGAVAEGAVGAGKGMVCCGFKGGIGTASRLVAESPWTVGVLVLANFGAREDLTVLGVPVGRQLHPADFKPKDGSIIMLVATDLPWDAHSLRRLAGRTAFGLARLGSVASHGSGDIAIAFSTAEQREPGHKDGGRLPSAAFHAVAEATEEAILNALTMAETTRGRLGHVVPALPLGEVLALLRERGAAPGG